MFYKCKSKKVRMIAVFSSSNHQHKEYLSVVLFAYNRWSLCCDKFLNVQYPFWRIEGDGTFSKNEGGEREKKGFEALYNHLLYMLGSQTTLNVKNTFTSNTSLMFDLK